MRPEHEGACCSSCIEDEEDQGHPNFIEHCCCEGYHAAEASDRPVEGREPAEGCPVSDGGSDG